MLSLLLISSSKASWNYPTLTFQIGIDKETLVSFVSSFSAEWRGLAQLFQIADAIQHKREDIVFLDVGSGPLLEKMKMKRTRCKAMNRVQQLLSEQIRQMSTVSIPSIEVQICKKPLLTTAQNIYGMLIKDRIPTDAWCPSPQRACEHSPVASRSVSIQEFCGLF